MIRISKPKIVSKNDLARLAAEIDYDGKHTSLWFEVDNSFSQYLCDERSDAFVLAILQWAMKYGHDIECEAPMTDRLYSQLTKQFLPAFFRANCFKRNGFKTGGGRGYALTIRAQVAPEVPKVTDGAIGTGVSTGVDSLHVFAMHPEVTHACLWTGIGANEGARGEKRSAAWRGAVEHSKRFAEHTGKTFVVGYTNFFDEGCLPNLQWSYYTTFGNLFCIYAMQKLWSEYYVASDCGVEHFSFKISLEEDPARYEFFLFPNVALSHLVVKMDGADCTRVDKVRNLIDYEPAQKFLNTCWRWDSQSGYKNCSFYCPKCMRTMLSLYGFDALEKFSAVYDVEYFKKHTDQYLAELYRGYIQKDFFITELKPYFINRSFPVTTRLGAWKIVLKKSLKKLIRMGRRGYNFSPEG